METLLKITIGLEVENVDEQIIDDISTSGIELHHTVGSLQWIFLPLFLYNTNTTDNILIT